MLLKTISQILPTTSLIRQDRLHGHRTRSIRNASNMVVGFYSFFIIYSVLVACSRLTWRIVCGGRYLASIDVKPRPHQQQCRSNKQQSCHQLLRRCCWCGGGKVAYRTEMFCRCMQVVKERDLIGAQLIRRNDELTLLYEKMKIMKTMMHKGELQYNERLEDIRILKLEIRHLRCKNSVLERSVKAMDDLR